MIETNWIRPAALGAIGGAAALALVGFNWGGWTTATTAASMADAQAQEQVALALTPFCMANYRADPNGGETLSALKAAQPYERRRMVMEAGWATPPGATDADRDLALACAEQLMNES